jgi:transcriptional regulator with XRE-family HTH domain
MDILLNNKELGENVQLHRKIKKMKAVELAKTLDISESAYTRYERGQAEFTITLVQKIAEALDISPLQLLSTQVQHYMNNGNNSPNANNANVVLTDSQWHSTDKEQSKLIMKLMENMVVLSDRILEMKK